MTAGAHRGFTFIELIIVVVITGIIAMVAATVIQGSMGAYIDQERRASLVADADRAMRRMSREIRTALPNSIRVDGDCGNPPCVEFLATVAGGRYRAGPGPAPVGGDPNRRLQFNQPDQQFNSTGPVGLPDGTHSLYVSVYNTGQAGNDAWAGQSMTQNPGVTLADDGAVPGETRVTLGDPHSFPQASPRQRFYLVEGPVTFACTGDRLNRHSGYAVGDPFTNAAGEPLATNVAGDATSCQFQYAAGSSSRAGLLTMTLELEEEGERVRLQYQIHVVNAP